MAVCSTKVAYNPTDEVSNGPLGSPYPFAAYEHGSCLLTLTRRNPAGGRPL